MVRFKMARDQKPTIMEATLPGASRLETASG
jgi:hypothetical protein